MRLGHTASRQSLSLNRARTRVIPGLIPPLFSPNMVPRNFSPSLFRRHYFSFRILAMLLPLFSHLFAYFFLLSRMLLHTPSLGTFFFSLYRIPKMPPCAPHRHEPSDDEEAHIPPQEVPDDDEAHPLHAILVIRISLADAPTANSPSLQESGNPFPPLTIPITVAHLFPEADAQLFVPTAACPLHVEGADLEGLPLVDGQGSDADMLRQFAALYETLAV